MNSLTSKTNPISKLLKPTSKTIYISLFSTSSNPPPPLPPPNYNSTSSRRQEDESRSVRVSVWWDIENCGVPVGINVFKIAHSITSAVRLNGIKGPVQITAFGDVFCLNRPNQEALSSTGVTLVHVPSGGKNSADRSLLVDLMSWVSQNPPPAHIFLISGDRDFAGILHKLRMSNYNILLSAREANQTAGVLYNASSIMWHWNELAKGENLSGKHFNQPPDGPYNSWYGRYRGPLEDPFAIYQQQQNSDPDDSSNAEQSSEDRYRPVPMAVLRQLRRVINSHPEGLTIKEFRVQLLKDQVSIDKDLYGYKKFHRFVQALPRIIKVESHPNNQLILLPVSTKIPKITRMVDLELPISSAVDEKEKIVEKKPGEEISEKKVLNASLKENDIASIKDPNGKIASNTEIVETLEIPVTSIEVYSSKQKNGLFRILWAKNFSRGMDAEKKLGDENPGGLGSCRASPEKTVFEEEQSKSSNPTHASSTSALNLAAKVDTKEKSEGSPGFVAKIINWCKFWRSESSSENRILLSGKESSSVEEDMVKFNDATCTKKSENNASHSRKHQFFTNDTFWNALQCFLETSRGSDIVLNSMSREQLAERLHKEGPLFLQPLQTIDISHLVDLLVSEKKWIKEFPSKNPYFRIVDFSEKKTSSTQPPKPTESSSIYSTSSSNENPQLKVSSTVHEKPSEKSKNEILSDCQKLVEEILYISPKGFNMGLLKKKFLRKYGYALDHKKLGYPKLVSLLQIIPGVKVNSASIFPDCAPKEKSTSSHSEKFDSTRKDDDVDSLWVELGPIENLNLDKEVPKSSPDGNGVYELSMSGDDEFSDMDRVNPKSSKVKVVNGKDSPLMQILDTWYSNKDEVDPKASGSDPETWVFSSSSEDESSPSGSFSPTVNNGRKHKSQKSYSFVVEHETEIKKNKAVDGILGGVKESGETKLQG